MKELITIGAYCPDSSSKKLLLECLKSLQHCRDKYDILVVTHLPLENYIYDYVDYVFFDKNNELLFDLEYLNPPWFSPNRQIKVTSSYVTGRNTYLAVYRLLIASFGITKTMGYKKVHGCIMSINVEKLNKLFLEYSREKLLELLTQSLYKTCESITEDVYLMDGETIYKENLNTLTDRGNKFNLSRSLSENEMDNWVVPYYNKYNNNIEGLVWNNKFKTPIKASFIINNDKIILFEETSLHAWQIKTLGNINEINTILIMVNDKIKLKIDFNKVDKELFKIKSHFLSPDEELKSNTK